MCERLVAAVVVVKTYLRGGGGDESSKTEETEAGNLFLSFKFFFMLCFAIRVLPKKRISVTTF